MAPLTSPSGCTSCSFLAEKIAALEQRISTLHQIREAELLMDTIVFRSTQPELESSTSPVSDVAPAVAASLPTSGVSSPDQAAAAPPPIAEPDVPFSRQGAKPKTLTSSTPCQPPSWTLVAPRNRRGRQPPQAPLYNIQLENKYDILDLHDFPLPASGSQAAPSKHHTRPTLRGARRLSLPQFTPAPRSAPAIVPAHPSPTASAPPPRPKSPSKTSPSSADPRKLSPVPPRPLFAPTTLIIGDSITRNVRFFNATTRCIPGATVLVILAKLPGILQTLPSSVHRIIVHVGCVDASRRQSEVTKSEFIKLFQYLHTCGKAVFISGPIAPYSRGCGLFSRILSLNTWLFSATRMHNLSFIDNFNLFWNRSTFYRTDGIHPNKLGSSVLTGNIHHAVQTLPH